jgi:hypothetical protein
MLIELGDEFYFMTCKDEGGRKKKTDPRQFVYA